jgi:hypothetical protein
MMSRRLAHRGQALAYEHVGDDGIVDVAWFFSSSG